MAKTQEELIQEEQQILNDLIHDMDMTLVQLDKKLTYEKLQAKKARQACLPDAYGMLVSAEHEKIVIRQKMRELYNGKDELYETRLVLDLTDERGKEREEVKVGLHTYMNGARIFIMSWKMPLCRHYILDNSAEEYEGVVTDKHGQKYNTHYQLRLKRQVKMHFDKIKSVTHFFPVVDEEIEQVIADEFLQELLNRRSGQEFKNIVFSIQKKQGEIIQTPFKQNLIVQGCAGSGKSMIMLHRLPIVIYDNPNSLDRNNLYIITPSMAYVQMANNMRIDLEIEDLKMGTLEQYYNHLLKKYEIDSSVYGTIKPYLKLNPSELKYVFSAGCINDIQKEIRAIYNEGLVDCKMGYALFGLKENLSTRDISTPLKRMRVEILRIQNILNANDNSLRMYHRNIFDLLTQLEECARMLENRKVSIDRALLQLIATEEKNIAERQKEIGKIDNLEEHEVMYQNRLNAINAAQDKIIELQTVRENVKQDVEYFEGLKEIANKIRRSLAFFVSIKSERFEMTLEEQYQVISNKDILWVTCAEVLKEIEKTEERYWEYTNSLLSSTKKTETALLNLMNNREEYLPLEYLKKLMDAKAYFSDAIDTAVQKIYLSFMKKLGQEPDEKGYLDALECSPYLYLQILYSFMGMPNAAKESLITIDEAQNMAPEELKLIKAINGNDVVFNLFGDVKQHIEGSKGIDDWRLIASIADFKKEYMQENYRNARQITSYCNKRFGLNMRAINLDGTGIHECKSKEEFDTSFMGIFHKPQNVGLSCILVKNKEEAETLLQKAENFKSRIHNITEGLNDVQRNKWNLMTAEQAKGLEFETVFAVSGRMSENEKYIAYTRALDELYVYDDEIELIKVDSDEALETEVAQDSETMERKQRPKRQSKENQTGEATIGLKEFFESKKLRVIDEREKSGYLWVIGSKQEIEPIVTEAMKLFSVTGKYGRSKTIGFKRGWVTKSKK